MSLPTIAMVGRTNVGKSTLFNRIVGGRRALVDDRPGVTRDRLVARADWAGRTFWLIDTGGFEAEPERELPGRVREQSLRAVASADVVILVVDGRAGVAPADAELARLLAATGKPVFLAVNKIDGEKQEALAYEFFSLGVDEPTAVSAEHGRRIDELLDRVVAALPQGADEDRSPALRLAIVGRPNVGKSSLLNRLVGEERMVVDAAAGTTRDAVDTLLEAAGETYLLVDTAGIRRRSRVERGLERSSVAAAFRALERAEVVLLVVDAAEGVTDQDARIAELAWQRGRGLLLVANKWDLLPHGERDPRIFLEKVGRRYRHLADVPAVTVSALAGTEVDSILPAARRVGEAFRSRLSTRLLNDALGEAVAAFEPPLVGGKRARVYYATAVGAAPPAVTLFVNDPQRLTTSYLRYLEKQIRAVFPLQGVPLRLVLRARPRRAFVARREGTPRARVSKGGRRRKVR